MSCMNKVSQPLWYTMICSIVGITMLLIGLILKNSDISIVGLALTVSAGLPFIVMSTFFHQKF